jgi:hypothetical protein
VDVLAGASTNHVCHMRDLAHEYVYHYFYHVYHYFYEYVYQYFYVSLAPLVILCMFVILGRLHSLAA